MKINKSIIASIKPNGVLKSKGIVGKAEEMNKCIGKYLIETECKIERGLKYADRIIVD